MQKSSLMMSDFNLEHLIYVISKNIQRLRKEFKCDEFCNNIISPMYNYLESRQLKSGSIYDDSAKSVLNFQYHTAYYILSSLLMYYLTPDSRYLENAKLSLQHLIKIGYDVNKRANSFIGIALGLSSLFCEDIEIRDKITRYIQELKFYPEINQKKKSANNFYALEGLALLLRYQLLKKEKDREEAEEIIKSYLIHWQYSDGFFYDSPFDRNIKEGIPHLSYHATMMMVIFFSSILLEDKNLFARGEKALSALQSVTSPCGEALSYGRSNNALFGFANAILACSLMAYCNPKKEANIDRYRCQLLHFVLRHQSKDGHLYIVPNSNEDARCGFDKYMFIVTYEAYGLSMLLLSHFIKPLNIEKRQSSQPGSAHHFVSREAGFVVYKSPQLSFGMNARIHQLIDGDSIDPRLVGGVPFWMTYDTIDVLPGMPFSHGFRTSKPSRLPFGDSVGEIVNYLIKWFRNLPYVVGFLPYIESSKSIGIFLGATEWDVSKFEKHGLTIEMHGPLWFVNTNGFNMVHFSVRRICHLLRKGSIKKDLWRVLETNGCEMERHITVDRNVIHFADTISGIDLEDYRLIPFSIRTYSDARVRTSQHHFTFRIPYSCLNLTMTRKQGEHIRLQKRVYSSKGAVLAWIINSDSKGIYCEDGRMVTRRTVAIEDAKIGNQSDLGVEY